MAARTKAFMSLRLMNVFFLVPERRVLHKSLIGACSYGKKGGTAIPREREVCIPSGCTVVVVRSKNG